MEDGIMLRDYAAALISKWWVVLLILVAATAAAIAVSSQLKPQYEVRTQLLLVSRTSEKLTSPPSGSSSLSSSLSVDTLSNLALANDLLEDIILTLRLADPGSGSLASVELLSSMMKVNVKASEQNRTAVLPLLTLTVRGGDPVQLKRIAETWADLFIQRNATLFASESARSFDYILSQYEETRKALQAKNQEKLDFLGKNPVRPLRTELLTLAGSKSQGAATTELGTESGSGLLIIDTTSQTGLFGKFIADLEQGRVSLAAATAEEKKLGEALKAEPPTLQQDINPVYIYLKEKLADASTQVASLTAEISQLESKTQELRKSINNLSEQVLKVEVAESSFDRDLAALTTNSQTLATKLQEARLAKEEQAGTIRVVESPIVPQVPVGPRRSQIFLPVGAIGLLVGIVMALMVHYIQRGTLRAAPPAPSRRSDT